MLAQLRNGLSSWRELAARRPALPASGLRYFLPMLVLAIGLTALVLAWLWRDDASYKPVFGATEKVAAADMMAVLDAEQIPYRLHPQTGQVLVPDAALGRVRMTLAARGVVAQLPAGLELLDKNDPLGVSQFVQDVRFRRGLEGELVQSILALDPVAAARVHLSLPRSSSFVSAGDDKGSASVVVTLKSGRQLSNEQIAAVVKLVAGSVSTLDPAKVTLVDQAGNLLSSRVELAEGGAPLASESDAARRFREEAIENVRALLVPVVGADNFKVSVTAEVDNDRVEETREQYGEAPKVTNEASREEKSSEAAALGIPGSLSNRPIAPDASAPAGEALGSRKNAVTRQYAYDRNITQIKRARGQLGRLSVAVVLNQAAAPAGRAWTPAQLAEVDRVLRNGLGIKAERGDALVVSAMAFPGQVAPEPWWTQRDTIVDGAGWLAYALALLLGYLLIARPVLRLLREWVESSRAAPVAPELAELKQARLEAPAVASGDEGGDGAARADAPAALPDPNQAVSPVVPLLENYDLPPAGSPVDVLVDHLKGLAAKEPERVAEVLKQWVQKKDGRSA
ncbi:flagellar M-ring protein FliF [Crenobacter luteus]|uniref:Flagellar M-ring protein n=1 Tax=Crenobacter luteus TaxID=1452487 RepID=A0A165F6U5_9NEIS|nr:flagellar basal-body MS-ring/collar protein FliF [Crenobacter luteus]KZE31735.1 flagellar MS-ring protein [Crenobacter luteus]TCP15599.1 flagellar M-ring protein FliF [Crenobacter luteus]